MNNEDKKKKFNTFKYVYKKNNKDNASLNVEMMKELGRPCLEVFISLLKTLLTRQK